MDYLGDRGAAIEHLQAARELGGEDADVLRWLRRLGAQ
jgi:hypothetical protein